MTNLELVLKGHYCHQWPRLQITVNHNVLFDGEIQGDQTLDLDFQELDHNVLVLRHCDKRFGEDNIWDTAQDQDRMIAIQDIRFNSVSIGHRLTDLEMQTDWTPLQLAQCSPQFLEQYSRFRSTEMRFNGRIELAFQAPVLNWLTMWKYKKPQADNESYFSSQSARWHYEEDLALIREIRQLMRYD